MGIGIIVKIQKKYFCVYHTCGILYHIRGSKLPHMWYTILHMWYTIPQTWTIFNVVYPLELYNLSIPETPLWTFTHYSQGPNLPHKIILCKLLEIDKHKVQYWFNKNSICWHFIIIWNRRNICNPFIHQSWLVFDLASKDQRP